MGGTQKDHIKSLVKMGMMDPPVGSSLPESLAHIYDMYKSIKFSRAKNSDGDGYVLLPKGQITYAEIMAYSSLTGSDLKPWEVDAIMGIESIFEASLNG